MSLLLQGYRLSNKFVIVGVQPINRVCYCSGTVYQISLLLQGYSLSNEFVVTQWPLKNTCKDFWRLIFDAHITSVIVLHDYASSRVSDTYYVFFIKYYLYNVTTCQSSWKSWFQKVYLFSDCLQNFPEFWPKKEGVKERFGPVCSTAMQTEHTPSLVIKTFNIKKVGLCLY